MTKMYTISQMVSERDDKHIGTLHREHAKFKKENNRDFSPVYHDEQIPIPTTYRLENPSAEDTPPKWINLGGSFLADKWYQQFKIEGDWVNQLTGETLERKSYLNPRRKGDVEPVAVVDGGGKEWRSSKEITLAMGVVPTFDGFSGRRDSYTNSEYDYLWRVKDGEANFKDTGRKIEINWGSSWTKVMGSLPLRNMLEEQVKELGAKFYSDSSEENEDLSNGEWRSVVESHLAYFMGGVDGHKGVIRDIMKRHADKLNMEDAVAVAFHALCEFAKKISDNKEELGARFRTSAYSWVKWYYQEALAEKEVINTKASKQKQEDRRTLNNLISELKEQLFREPTFEEIKKGSGWGDSRIESTYRLFDFNIGKHRSMNTEELLYTVMNEHLTDRQSSIVEMNYGLNGSKFTLPEIADELGLNEKTIRRDKAKALEIIEEKLNFKFSSK